jgi:signal peptidase I
MMLRLLRELISSALLAVVLFVAIDSITVRSQIEGPSMQPNLRVGQIVLVSRLGISGLTRQAYAAAHGEANSESIGWVPPRGAMVTFVHPFEPGRQLVKRVIGLPGEEIAIDRGDVYINGERLDEPYVVFHDTRSLSAERIPLDSLFVMGDNRPESGDSRMFGPVPRANLQGIVLFRYWPLSELQWLMR